MPDGCGSIEKEIVCYSTRIIRYLMMRLSRSKKVAFMAFMVVISASSCTGEENSSIQDGMSPDVSSTESISPNELLDSPSKTEPNGSVAAAPTTPKVESPFFSGHLTMTHASGWVWSVQIPPLVGVDFKIKKDVASYPPGQASTVVDAKPGNVLSIKITPNTPGRNAPELMTGAVYFYVLPAFTDIYCCDYGYHHQSSACDIASTDLDPTTDDFQIPQENKRLVGFMCWAVSENKNDTLFGRADDEVLVDNFIELFDASTFELIVGLGACTLLLNQGGSYKAIKHEGEPIPWEIDNDCRFSE